MARWTDCCTVMKLKRGVACLPSICIIKSGAKKVVVQINSKKKEKAFIHQDAG
jgi:hypothetical protein